MTALPVRIADPCKTTDRVVEEALHWAGRELPEWGMSPSPFDWQVMVFGGTDPRTGFAQEPQVFQFFKRRYSAGYSLNGVIARAESVAERQHRTHYAVRDTNGEVVHVGETFRVAGMVEDFTRIVKGVWR